MIRVWFNHWFGTIYNVINMLKQADPEIYIISTNKKEKYVVSAVSDESYSEPILYGDEYVDFCLDFCKIHKIDIFVPRYEMLSVSKRKTDFNSIGVKVMVDDYDIVAPLNYKDRAYKMLAQKGVSTIPEYHIAKSADEFLSAYDALKKKYQYICFKFVQDEGGLSFRLIDNTRNGYSSLFKKQRARITLDSAIEALSEKESFDPMIIMPYLPGAEVSADCLKTNSGLILIPRIKDSSRVERLCFDDEVVEKVREVYDAVQLEFPCNIQLKYLDGKLYFLEVNTRMSGGVQMSCAAADVNIPYIAISKILGKEIEWTIRKEKTFFSQVNVPVIL